MVNTHILNEIGTLSQVGFRVIKKSDTIYYIYGKDCTITLTINPEAPVLELSTLRNDKPSISYTIDTDLYNLSHPKFSALGQKIIDAMTQLLEDLRTGKILHGIMKGKDVLIIPQDEGYVQMPKGRFLVRSKRHLALEKAANGADLQALN